MTIGEKIRKYRTFKGITQAALGKMVGLSGDRIRQYENDVRTPKDGKLFEIADALGVNALALSNPDLENPNSIMHILFELEEQYGLRIDRDDNTYTLSFIQNEHTNANWLKNGLNDWIRKRNELQPDINDSDSTIEQKKRDYITWKARYPYNFGKQMEESQQVLHEFQNTHSELLSDDYKPVNTFSDFYEYFIAFVNTGLPISIERDYDGYDSIRIKIDQDELFHAPESVIATYMEFARIVSDMKDIGLNTLSFSCRTEDDDKLYVFFYFTNNQMTTLLSHFKSIREKLESEIIDESTYEADIKDTLRMYNIPIKDYI